MGLVLDAVFAAIVLCFVVAGYRAGLMRTLVEFVGYLFAVVASVVLAGLVADVLADLFLQARAPSPTEYYFLRVIATAIVFVLLQMLVRMIASAVSAVCRCIRQTACWAACLGHLKALLWSCFCARLCSWRVRSLNWTAAPSMSRSSSPLPIFFVLFLRTIRFIPCSMWNTFWKGSEAPFKRVNSARIFSQRTLPHPSAAARKGL